MQQHDPDQQEKVARILRRMSINEVENLARERGLLGEGTWIITDLDFLNEVGYSPEEYLMEAFEYRSNVAVKQINDALRKRLQKRLAQNKEK